MWPLKTTILGLHLTARLSPYEISTTQQGSTHSTLKWICWAALEHEPHTVHRVWCHQSEVRCSLSYIVWELYGSAVSGGEGKNYDLNFTTLHLIKKQTNNKCVIEVNVRISFGRCFWSVNIDIHSRVDSSVSTAAEPRNHWFSHVSRLGRSSWHWLGWRLALVEDSTLLEKHISKAKNEVRNNKNQNSCWILFGESINLTMINWYVFSAQPFQIIALQRNDPSLSGLELEGGWVKKMTQI